MQATSAGISGLRRVLFCLLLAPLLVSCEAIWGGLSRSNFKNCVAHPGSCNYAVEYCSPDLERCQPLGPPCTIDTSAAVCAITGPDRICFPDLGRCATNVILDNVNPASGPVTGGVPITLIGQYFRSGMRVSFDGATADVIEVVSANKMVVNLPASTTGPGPAVIRVEHADGGYYERSDLFTYGQNLVSFSNQPINNPQYGDEIEVIDNNRDFDPDLIAQLDTNLVTARGNGGGSFQTGLLGTAEYSVATSELESADFDNSGTPDVVFGAKHPTTSGDGIIYTAINDNLGNLSQKQSLPLPSTGTATRVALGDA